MIFRIPLAHVIVSRNWSDTLSRETVSWNIHLFGKLALNVYFSFDSDVWKDTKRVFSERISTIFVWYVCDISKSTIDSFDKLKFMDIDFTENWIYEKKEEIFTRM